MLVGSNCNIKMKDARTTSRSHNKLPLLPFHMKISRREPYARFTIYYRFCLKSVASMLKRLTQFFFFFYKWILIALCIVVVIVIVALHLVDHAVFEKSSIYKCQFLYIEACWSLNSYTKRNITGTSNIVYRATYLKYVPHLYAFIILLCSSFSECRFSDKRYELEETWHPDLGPPFGVMYCVHCECVAVRKY